MRSSTWEKGRRLAALYWLLKTQLWYRVHLGGLGRRSRIVRPLDLRNMQHIYIGSQVTVSAFSWLMTLPSPSGPAPRLVIGDGAAIGHFNHITCVNRVDIGPKVLTADRVHISDNTHDYEDPRMPIIDQPLVSKGPVAIGEGTWLGENASVLSCRIGRNCVVGANAVVIRDLPDFCVAVGAPARVIKRFNEGSGKWERV